MAESDNEIELSVKDFIDKNFLMNSGLVKYSNTDSFMEKGIIDSTGILELVNFIQQTFSIDIGNDELLPENFDSIRNICEYVQKKQLKGS